MMRRKLPGMTLVEILFAFAIISTVVVIAYAAALNAWRSAESANQRTEAQYVAQSALEQVKAYRDLSDSGTSQKRMLWSAGRNGGIGGFLQEVQAMQGAGGGFTVQDCLGATPSRTNCEWVVQQGTRVNRAPGDNILFTVIIVAGELTCQDGTISTIVDMCSNAPLEVTSITLQARVSWTTTSGVLSEAIASTIITEPD